MNRLPHDDRLVVHARLNHDQVTSSGIVDRRLDGLTGRYEAVIRRCAVVDRNRNGVLGSIAIVTCYDELTGQRIAADAGDDRVVVPALDVERTPTNRNRTRSLTGTESRSHA